MRLVAAILFIAGLILVILFLQQMDFFDKATSTATSLIIIILVLATLAGLLAIAAFLRYKRPRADQALVRTGGRKYKVKFEGGGLFLFTIIHEVRPVSLNTMRLDILRQGPEESLITGDFMRVDVQAVFYIRVEADEESVVKAAQTLGERAVSARDLRRNLSIGRKRQPPPGPGTSGPEAKQDLMLENIKALLDDKVDGALRAVAATMELEQLQMDRKAFAEEVRSVSQEDLKENGLFLETVTITMLNQTPISEMDPDNRFDAVGIKAITEITKKAFKEKEKILKETEVAVKEIEVNAAKEKFVLEKDKAWAEAEKEKEIATYSAEKEAETVKVSYEQELIGKKAGILKEQELEKADIEKIQTVEVAKVEQEQKVAERGIEKNLAVETKTIEQGQKVAEREIQFKLEVTLKAIEQEQTVETKEYEKKLAIEKAKLAQEEGIALRDVEKILAISMAKIQQEQEVQEREIEKNKLVEVAQIDMGQKIQEREIDRNLIIQEATFVAQVGIKDAEVTSLKKQYVLEKDRVLVDADQKKIIQSYTATRKAEGTRVQFEQEAIAEQARIAKDQAIMEREIEKNRYIEVAQIEQGQKIQEREIERNLIIQEVTFDAQVGIKDAEVGSLKKQYVLEKDRVVVDADQKKIIQAYTATRKAEGTRVQFEQEAVAEQARIAKDQAIMEREIEKNRYIEVAQIEQGQKIQEREIERNLVIQEVTFSAQVGIKDAEVSSLKTQYTLEKDRVVVDADQKKIIQAYTATRKAEGTRVQFEQEAVAEQARIAKDQAIMEREIEKNRYIEVAQIEQGQKIQEREIERNLIIQEVTFSAQVGIKDAEVSSLKTQYTLEKDRVVVDADQKKIIQAYTATRKAEGTRVQFEQEAVAEQARIAKDQAIMEREIEKNRYIEVAQIEQGQKIQEREIERNLVIQEVTFSAQVGIKDAEVSSLKTQYTLEKDRVVVDADQKKIIQAYTATRKAEGTRVQFEQEAVAEQARIAKDQAIMEREIEKNRYIEVAQIEQGQKIQEREIERNLVIQEVTFDAQVGIKDAEVSSLKKQYVFEKDRVLVDADQKKIIQAYTSTRKAEGTKVQFEQEAVVEKAKITKDETIMEREIEKNKVIEKAQISMGEVVQIREIERNLEVQKSTFGAQVGIKRADVESQVQQLGMEKDRSWAEADQRKQITTYTAERMAEAAKIQYQQDIIKETARISREQTVMEREIDKNMVIEKAQINMGKQVMQVEIDQKLIVGLADEDRKIAIELKMKDTDLAVKTHLEATALKNTADVHAITVQRVGEAERDKEVAIIGAEREAKPMERLADAILAQAKAKAEGEKKAIEAKNVTEQRVLIQQAIMSFIDTAPQLVERLMKPVEKIESIRILDMGGSGGSGLDKSAMGRIASNLMDTGSVMPMVKEFLKFADVNADDLAKKASEYLSGLIKIQPK